MESQYCNPTKKLVSYSAENGMTFLPSDVLESLCKLGSYNQKSSTNCSAELTELMSRPFTVFPVFLITSNLPTVDQQWMQVPGTSYEFSTMALNCPSTNGNHNHSSFGLLVASNSSSHHPQFVDPSRLSLDAPAVPTHHYRPIPPLIPIVSPPRFNPNTIYDHHPNGEESCDPQQEFQRVKQKTASIGVYGQEENPKHSATSFIPCLTSPKAPNKDQTVWNNEDDSSSSHSSIPDADEIPMNPVCMDQTKQETSAASFYSPALDLDEAFLQIEQELTKKDLNNNKEEDVKDPSLCNKADPVQPSQSDSADISLWKNNFGPPANDSPTGFSEIPPPPPPVKEEKSESSSSEPKTKIIIRWASRFADLLKTSDQSPIVGSSDKKEVAEVASTVENHPQRSGQPVAPGGKWVEDKPASKVANGIQNRATNLVKPDCLINSNKDGVAPPSSGSSTDPPLNHKINEDSKEKVWRLISMERSSEDPRVPRDPRLDARSVTPTEQLRVGQPNRPRISFPRCDLCGVIANSAMQWKAHVGGQKHQRAANKIGLETDFSIESRTTETVRALEPPKKLEPPYVANVTKDVERRREMERRFTDDRPVSGSSRKRERSRSRSFSPDRSYDDRRKKYKVRDELKARSYSSRFSRW